MRNWPPILLGIFLIAAFSFGYAETTPSPKPKTSATAKKKKKSSPSPSPSKTPAAKKKKAKSEEEDDVTPTPKRKGGKKLTAAEKKRAKASASASSKASVSAKKEEIKKEAAKAEPELPSATPLPSQPAINLAPGGLPQVDVEKSGLLEEQGYEPPPPPPRGFWSRLFGRADREPTNFRYLSRSVVEEIRRAPVQRRRWQFIVVHNSGTRQGSARAFDYYHKHVRKMQNGLAYHFVIGNGTSTGDGEVEIGDRWRRQINGGHVHSDYLNNIALGICLVGDFNRSQPTPRQLEACEELIKYLRRRCGKTDRGEIVVRPHREVNPPQWATDCPGDDFPYTWFRRF